MVTTTELRAVLIGTHSYLREVLLPFWIERAPDTEGGGFLTYFDARGEPTGETTKTLLMQLRMIYAMARAHRAGYGGGRCAELARAGVDFVLEHYWDQAHGGWYWIADREGQPTVTAKIGYGQCFAMYAFAEYFLATGDQRGKQAMERSHGAVMHGMRDRRNGGYLEVMERDWQPVDGEGRGGDRKSFDVHMHMMEALTHVLEVTGDRVHRVQLLEVIDLICGRMLDRASGTGLMQFTLDFTPLPAVRLAVEWGSDEAPAGGAAFPLDTTSYGHNVEFAWLLLHAADVLAVPRESYAPVVRRIVEHCIEFGIDREKGGIYVDGPIAGPAQNRHKQFWQHAEALVGILDAWLLFGERRIWDAFRNVHDFVFDKFIDLPGGGEWFALLDRDGTPIEDYQGHAWKISYHTVRSMIEVTERLAAELVRRSRARDA